MSIKEVTVKEMVTENFLDVNGYQATDSRSVNII